MPFGFGKEKLFLTCNIILCYVILYRDYNHILKRCNTAASNYINLKIKLLNLIIDIKLLYQIIDIKFYNYYLLPCYYIYYTIQE